MKISSALQASSCGFLASLSFAHIYLIILCLNMSVQDCIMYCVNNHNAEDASVDQEQTHTHTHTTEECVNLTYSSHNQACVTVRFSSVHHGLVSYGPHSSCI